MKRKTPYLIAAFFMGLFFHAAYSIVHAARLSRQWVQEKDMSAFSRYVSGGNYFLSLSYALTAAFTVYGAMKFYENRKARSAAGGLTLAGILYAGGCFLTGCCGSPMLAVYVSLFGASFLGWMKPVIFALTLISVIAGVVWMERKTGAVCPNCAEDNSCAGEES